MLLSNSCIRKIIAMAINKEILIISVNLSVSDSIYAEIKYFAKHILNLSVVTFPVTLYISGLKPIVITEVNRWNDKDLPYNPFVRAYRGDFDGIVLVTDKSIARNLTGIADGVRAKYLPIEFLYASNNEADRVIESFQAKLDKIKKNHNIE